MLLCFLETKIGYPDYITNTSGVDDYYESLEVAENLFDSHLNYRVFLLRKNAEKIGTVPDDKK